MIDEAQHDLAVEYVLGELTGEARREFESWLASDREMQVLVDEISEATASLVHAAPLRPPPASIRTAVVGNVRTVRGAATATAARAPRWPWIIAVLTTAAALALLAERQLGRSPAGENPSATAAAESARAAEAAAAAEKEKRGLTGRLQLAEMQAKVHVEQIAQLGEQLAKLRARDPLGEAIVAPLKPAGSGPANGTVVWNAADQRGLLIVSGLPAPKDGSEYQLWLLDTATEPARAGTVALSPEGDAAFAFRPTRPLDKVTSFAITLEPAGSTGPMSPLPVLSGSGSTAGTP